MSEEVIDRVDDLVRKNNLKYKDQMTKKEYELALKDYQKQSKYQQNKLFNLIVKQGNKKAIEKAKFMKRQQKLKKKVKKPKLEELQPQQLKPIQNIKNRKSLQEVNLINKTIQARAERIIQEQQLQKLTKKLQQQKKRTKLYDLNQKCKKMLSKSHEKIVSAKNLPLDKLNILQGLQAKAMEQINDLDDQINQLIDMANKKDIKKSSKTIQFKALHHKQQETDELQFKHNMHPQDYSEQGIQNGQQNQYQDSSISDDEPLQNKHHFNNFLNINTLIFQKNSEELLKMNYIPL